MLRVREHRMVFIAFRLKPRTFVVERFRDKAECKINAGDLENYIGANIMMLELKLKLKHNSIAEQTLSRVKRRKKW